MPQAFLNCQKQGGKIRTIKVGKTKYRRICRVNGKSYLGEVKTKKK